MLTNAGRLEITSLYGRFRQMLGLVSLVWILTAHAALLSFTKVVGVNTFFTIILV